MLVASACLAVFIVAAWLRFGGGKQPLGRDEVNRLRRFAERMQRDESLPFE
jgi:hypothetical protein